MLKFNAGIGGKPYFFKRYIGMTQVWAQQGNANNALGFSISTGGTGSSTARDDNRFVVTCGPGVTTYVSIAYAIQASNIPGISEISGLFDQYKIHGFSFMVIPGQNSVDSGTSPLPVYHSVLDHDDATPAAASETGLDTYRERYDYNVRRCDQNNRVFKRYIKNPSLQIGGLTSGGTVISTIVSRPRWLDAADTEVPHFGIKLMIEMYNPSTGEVDVNFEIMAKAYISARRPH